ncbi:MAG: hypothetical protein V1767_00870 [Chloroflexota bacterium]
MTPSRTEYNECMRPYISGTHDDRKLSFCAGAKICTGKADTVEEAELICRSQPPKPAKISSHGKLNSKDVAVCLLSKITDCNSLTTDTLASYVTECTGKKIKKPESKKQFIKKCAEEATIKGTFAESVSLQKKCLIQWKQKELEILIASTPTTVTPEVADVSEE